MSSTPRGDPRQSGNGAEWNLGQEERDANGNHPFVDGNKRIAFAAVDVVLRISGFHIQGRPLTIYRQMMKLFESGTFELRLLDRLLRKVVVADR